MRTAYPLVSLDTVLSISTERIEPSDHAGERYNYIGLEHIEGHSGRLLSHPTTDGSEIKSTKNVFHRGQILYGKLRPYLNKVHLGECDGICSTDIYVLNPKGDKVLSPFAAYFLRSPIVLNQIENLMQGANLPRLSPRALLGIQVPLPPLPEQERIVRLLDAVEELRRLRAVADRRTADLIPALFNEMFGDPGSNLRGWETKPLGDLTSFVTSGSRGWARYYSNQGARFIRVQDLTDHQLALQDLAFVSPPENAESKRTSVRANDLLLSITGVVGLAAITPPNIGCAYVSQHVAIIRLKEQVEPVFVANFLAQPAGGQHQFSEMQYGQTKPGLNLTQVRALRILCPPSTTQRQFAARVAEIRALEIQQAASRRRLDDLFQSMLHRAFRGKL